MHAKYIRTLLPLYARTASPFANGMCVFLCVRERERERGGGVRTRACDGVCVYMENALNAHAAQTLRGPVGVSTVFVVEQGRDGQGRHLGRR